MNNTAANTATNTVQERTRWRRLFAVGLATLSFWLPAQAHKASDAYAALSDTGTPGQLLMRLSLAVKDLDAAVETLDANNDRQITWGEIRQALPTITAWVGEGLTLRCGAQDMQPGWVFESLEARSDGAYVRLAARLNCAAGQPLVLDYQLMKTLDPTHRLLLAGQVDGQPLAGVLAPQGRSLIALRADATGGKAQATGSAEAMTLPTSGPGILAHFLPEGVHHIATGYDHLAFLLALLLPISLGRRVPGRPLAAGHRIGPGALITTVTGFTVGHSITLVLATLGVISSPGWVEPAIAVTIGLSALQNLYPLRWIRGDALALFFGLIHGLGFSNVMAEAGVSGPLLPWALAGFNLGVEAGQLAGVAIWCGVHVLLVRWTLYERVVVRGGSWALLALAAYWAVQRVL